MHIQHRTETYIVLYTDSHTRPGTAAEAVVARAAEATVTARTAAARAEAAKTEAARVVARAAAAGGRDVGEQTCKPQRS